METFPLHPEPSSPGTGTLFPASRSTAQIPCWRAAAALRRQVIRSSITAWKSGIISRQVPLNPDERAAGMFHPLPSLRSIPCSASTWDGIGTSIPPRRDGGGSLPLLAPSSPCPWDEAGPAGIWDTAACPAPGPWTPNSPPAVSTLLPGSALAAAEIYGERRGRRAGGGVNKRHIPTLSPAPGAVSPCHAAPRVPPGPARPRASHAAHPNPHRDPHTAPRGWELRAAPSL